MELIYIILAGIFFCFFVYGIIQTPNLMIEDKEAKIHEHGNWYYELVYFMLALFCLAMSCYLIYLFING